MDGMNITESAIETFAIELFEKLGYQYFYGPAIAPDSEKPERERFEDVLLLERLRRAVARINPSIPASRKSAPYRPATGKFSALLDVDSPCVSPCAARDVAAPGSFPTGQRFPTRRPEVALQSALTAHPRKCKIFKPS
jgi:hypothetical protein